MHIQKADIRLLVVALASLLFPSAQAGTFRVATYNLENYLDAPSDTRPAKSEAAKAKIRESILAARPDVLAVEEMGSNKALTDLRDALKLDGLTLPHSILLPGNDTNIHVAVLSKFPLAHPHLYTNEQYLLNGRRFRVSRGFFQAEVQVTPTCSFTLIAAHLKSKRTAARADEVDMRYEEARLLREKIESVLASDPAHNLVVLGDFNDTKDSPSLRAIMGRGRTRLIDTRPAERNGDAPAQDNAPDAHERRDINWTHYYGHEDSYSRIDYLLVSPGMAKVWRYEETFIPTVPGWGMASDHRPIVATFDVEDK